MLATPPTAYADSVPQAAMTSEPMNGSDEVADAVHPAKGRQCPRPHRDRHGLGEVGLPGQPEEGAREADDEDADEEHDETARERRDEHAGGLDHGGDEQRAALTDARGERARGQVAEQLTHAHHRDEERGNPDRGTELARRHGDDRRHRPRARRTEEGGAVCRQRDRAQAAAAALRAVSANLGHATGP